MAGIKMAKKHSPERAPKITNYGIPPEVFVAAWEAAANFHEVYATLKAYSEAQGTPVMPGPIIASRAAEYRKSKVPLKLMPRVSSRNLDAKALTEVVAKVRSEQGAPAPTTGDEPVLTRAQVEEVVVEVLRKYGLVK